MLERNPLRKLALPREASPARPVCRPAQYEAIRRVAAAVGSWAELFAVLVHETGHRAGSMRQLRWSDVDLEAATVRSRAEFD